MTTTSQRTYSQTLDEEVLHVEFPSGLRVFFCPKRGFKKKYACYSTYYGAVDTELSEPGGGRVKVPDGIAHFLEHTLFETDEGNVSDIFSRRGAYSNAATSFTTTAYLFAASDNFFEHLKLLLSFVENPSFRPEKVEKEKGIIEQEIKGYDDSPGWVGYMGLLENLFQAHPIRVDIAGSPESIRQITSDSLHRSYNAFYSPANMILFVVGDVDAAELFDFVAENSGNAKARRDRSAPIQRVYPKEPRAVACRETRKEMEVALPKLLLGFKEVDTPRAGEAFVLHDLASDFALGLLFGRSSNTFRELYEAQVIQDDFSASYGIGAGIGYGVVSGDTPDPDRLREILLGKISSLLKDGIREEDFEREKRRFIGSFIRGFNSLEYIAGHYTYYKFHDFDLFRSVDLLQKLEKRHLEERLCGLLDVENHASFVILPRGKAS